VAAVSQRLYRALFPLCQRLGFHLTPNHFYQPIPDTRTLDDSLWDRQSDLVGIDMREEKQLLLLATLAEKYKHEYNRLPRSRKETSQPYEYYLDNPALGPVDGEILYAMIRHFAPGRVVEIGAGFTTRLAAQAIGKNTNPCELVSIDPYPPPEVETGFPGLTRLLRQPVQSVPLQEFEKLGKNDILLIDSSHVLKIGSDVWHEYLEILPRLRDGVVVHIHDIFLPLEYPIDWVRQEYRFFNEQYLLQGFLTFNNRFDVLWAGGYMALKYPAAVKAALPNFDEEKCWPGSFWMRKTEKQ
jgi:hypothetical protein